ncbi:MAG: YitT family protein [Cellulosilyticaceae bacterium]
MKRLLITRKELGLIIAGCLIVSLTINWFLAPAGLVTGGISGLAIIIEAVSKSILGFAIPISVTTLVLNVPLFIVAIKQKGFAFVKKSFYSVGITTILIELTSYLPNIFAVEDDLLVTALIGGVGFGVGIGLVLRSGATTGGTDMLATIIRTKFPKFPIAKLVMMIDAMIVTMGLFIFGANKAVYAIIAIYITSRVLANVLEGMHYAKAAFIMSSKSEEISRQIMEQIPRGSTGLKARGMYSKEDKEMLFTVVSQKEITQLRDIISQIDPKAFVAIADVREVLGQGFIEDFGTVSV